MLPNPTDPPAPAPPAPILPVPEPSEADKLKVQIKALEEKLANAKSGEISRISESTASNLVEELRGLRAQLAAAPPSTSPGTVQPSPHSPWLPNW